MLSRRLLSPLAPALAALALAPAAQAVPAFIPPVVAVHAEPAGVVAFDEGAVTLHKDGIVRPLASLDNLLPNSGEALAGSGRWIVARGREGLVAGVPPAALTPVPAGGSAGPKGCSGWHVDPTQTESFAVVDRQLVIAGTQRCAATPSSSARRPLFARPLAGGRWRVVTWLPVGSATSAVQLTASGRLLAFAVQPANQPMQVQVVDVHTGATRLHTTFPQGRLALDADGTLVATTQTLGAPFTDAPQQVLVATPRAPHARVLASDAAPATENPQAAVVADGRVVYETAPTTDGVESLDVVSTRGGAPRPIVSFRDPQRSVYAFDLRGSNLTWMQNETPLVPVDCYSSPYGIPGPRRLQTVNVATAVPIPAPAPPAPRPDPATLLAQCGPPPPPPPAVPVADQAAIPTP